jgi:hypothetical protein
MTAAQKTFIGVLLFAGIAASQFLYDANKVTIAEVLPSSITPETARLLDMGFHSTVGSFLWIKTMPEILDFFNRKSEYTSDLAYLNTVDPKLSYPYAFSIITLPAIPKALYPNALSDSMAIGERGLANADPDWRIAYYMATNYYVQLKDFNNALKYFNIAAQTPGVPYFAKRFAENFGADAKDRDRTRDLWMSIRDTTNDENTKERAEAYIERLNMFDYLEAATAQYKKKYGVYPTNINQLIEKHVIPGVPQDPFGFTFVVNSNGTAGIDLSGTPGQ